MQYRTIVADPPWPMTGVTLGTVAAWMGQRLMDTHPEAPGAT